MPLVEFVGLPASGKTTVAKALCVCLQQNGMTCGVATTLPLADGWCLLRKLIRLFIAAASNPATAVFALVTIHRSRQQHLSDALRTFCNLMEVRYALRAVGGGVVVMDQGPCQALWSVAYSARRSSTQSLRRLALANLPRRRLVVFISSSAGAAIARSARRGTSWSRLERESGPRTVAWARAVRAQKAVEAATPSALALVVANPEGLAGETTGLVLNRLFRSG